MAVAIEADHRHDTQWTGVAAATKMGFWLRDT
jgi:hypothetical protein